MILIHLYLRMKIIVQILPICNGRYLMFNFLPSYFKFIVSIVWTNIYWAMSVYPYFSLKFIYNVFIFPSKQLQRRPFIQLWGQLVKGKVLPYRSPNSNWMRTNLLFLKDFFPYWNQKNSLWKYSRVKIYLGIGIFLKLQSITLCQIFDFFIHVNQHRLFTVLAPSPHPFHGYS